MDWSSIITWSNAAYLLSAIFALIVAAVATKYKELVDEIGNFLEAYAKAKCKTSPGGKTITPEEREQLIEKAASVLKLVFEVFSTGLIGKLGSVLKKIAEFFKRVF